MVIIAAFQAGDPGSIPGRRNAFFEFMIKDNSNGCFENFPIHT